MNSIVNLLYASLVLYFVKPARSFKQLIKCFLVISIFWALTLLPGVSLATSVTLAWDPNQESDLAGYRIYYGETSGEYSFEQDVDSRTEHTVNYLGEGKTYYFAVTAYNLDGFESDYSRELVYTVPVESSTTTADPPPDIPAGDPADSLQSSDGILAPVRTSANGSTLNFGFNFNLANLTSTYKAELKFRAATALPFVSVFYQNKWIKALASVKANAWITVDVSDIVSKSSGSVDFKLQCSGLTGSSSVDQVIRDLQLVIYPANDGIPVATFSANPVTGSAPLMVGFDAAAAFDPDGYLVEYEWEFGDNNYSDAAAAVNHLYIDPGVYTAKLTVTDDEGNTGSQQIQITVVANTYNQNTDNSTVVVYPSEIRNDAVSFELGGVDGAVSKALLRFRVLKIYTTVVVYDDNNREVARKYSVAPNKWYEFDLTDVVDSAGSYAFKVLAQPLYDVRLLPLTEYEAIELVVSVE